jgi:hypothetical protein
MDLRSGILQTAQSVGVDPLDLATVISYETAGTFDPTKRGPTTQWGQHRGLIQFGEPQARQYGVDWNDPLGSQLGPEGAVANYLKSSGVKPGMGLLDLYSTVNAGAPGLYNRSDANNGGAPGTVRDKVENQMAGHREKAAALLGGDYTPRNTGGQMAQNNGLLGNMTLSTQGTAPEPEQKPWLKRDKTQDMFDRLVIGLEGMRMNPNEALMQTAQGRISNRRKTKANATQRNKTADWLEQNGMGPLAEGVRNGSITAQQAFALAKAQQGGGGYRTLTGEEAARMGLDPNKAYNMGPDGKITSIGGGGVNVSVGGQGPQVGTIPQGYQMVQDQETGAYRMEPIPGGPEDTSSADANRAENEAAGAVNVLGVVDKLKQDIEANPTMTTGLVGSIVRSIPGTGAYNAEATAQTIKANLAFDALAAMRKASPTGGALGAVSERELALLDSQIANLDMNQSTERVLDSLERIEQQYTRLLQKAYETGDPAALDAALGGRPEFMGGASGTDDDALFKKYGVPK